VVKDQPLALSYCLKEYDFNMETIDPHKSIDYMIKNAKAYAQAKAKVTYLEQFRKSKKAILFASAMGNTIADKESYAYSHPEYLELLEGLKAAVEEAERLRWMLVAAQARIDVYRTQEASNRSLDRITQ
jgi:hypothetical protein